VTRVDSRGGAATPAPAELRRKRELLAFLFLTVVLWPVIAVAVVGGWGLTVWLYQAMGHGPSL